MDQMIRSNIDSVTVMLNADEFARLRVYAQENGYGYDLESALRDRIRAFLNDRVGTNPPGKFFLVSGWYQPDKDNQMKTKNDIYLCSLRLPAELERSLRERMRITLQSLSATVAELLQEGMWLDLPRLSRALPEGEMVAVQVRLPASLVARLRERAGRTRRTQNAEIVFLLALALEHEADDGRLVRTALDGETECQVKGGTR